MKRKPLILLAAVAGMFALLTSCGDNVVESFGSKGNNDIFKEGVINVYVRDGAGGDSIITGATVTLLNGSDPRRVDRAKGVSYTGLTVGDYAVRAYADGYTGYFNSNIRITNENNFPTSNPLDTVHSLFIARTVTIEATLYPLTAGLEGNVYYDKGNGKRAVADGAEIVVTLDQYTFAEKRVYSAFTDDEGNFKFENLPAVGNQYTLTALPYTKGDSVSLAEAQIFPAVGLTSLPLRPGVTAANAGTKLVYASALSEFIIVNKDAVYKDTGDVITLRFNQPVDVSRLSDGELLDEAHTFTYSTDKKTITLISRNDRWYGKTLIINTGNLYSESGVKLRTSDQNVSITIKRPVEKINIVGDTSKIFIADSMSPIVLQFSDAIDRTKEPPSVTVNGVEAKLAFNAGNDEITITPYREWTKGTAPAAASDLIVVLNDFVGEKGETLDQTSLRVTVRSRIKEREFPFVIVGLPDTLKLDRGDTNKVITLTFSDSIDATSALGQPVDFSNAQAASFVVDGNTLTITPAGNWHFVDDELEIVVSSKLKSTRGVEADPSVDKLVLKRAPIDMSGKIVAGLKIKDTTSLSAAGVQDSVMRVGTTLRLTWDKVTEASDYYIWQKVDSVDRVEGFTGVYKKIGERQQSQLEQIYEVTLESGENSFVVQPVYKSGANVYAGKLSATPVVVKTRPTIASIVSSPAAPLAGYASISMTPKYELAAYRVDSALTAVSGLLRATRAPNTDNLKSDTGVIQITFTEQMKTSVVLDAPTRGKLKIRTEWVETFEGPNNVSVVKTLRIYYIVDAGPGITESVTLDLNLTNLESQNGSPFFRVYGTYNLRTASNDLKIGYTCAYPGP